MLMQVNLEATGWQYTIKPKEGEEIVYRHDRLALAAILQSIPPDVLAGLRKRRTVATASVAIKQICVWVQRVHMANM